MATLQQELEEVGFCTVTTLAIAEAVAGFKVAVPSFIPDDFHRQENINISQLGGGLPEELRTPDGPITVETFYFLEEDDDVLLYFRQTLGNVGLGGGEAVVLCGLQCERTYSEADSQRRPPGPILTLSCQKDDTTYAIFATVAGPLDEAMIEQIFCSLMEN